MIGRLNEWGKRWMGLLLLGIIALQLLTMAELVILR